MSDILQEIREGKVTAKDIPTILEKVKAKEISLTDVELAIRERGFTFKELSDKAKDNVRIWYAEHMEFYDDWHTDYWDKKLMPMGYENCEYRWEGFYHQGSGATIKCDVKVKQFIKYYKLGRIYSSLLYWLKQIDDDYKGYAHIHVNGRGIGYLSIDMRELASDLYSIHATDQAIAQAKRIADVILDDVREKSDEFFIWLRNDYEYRLSDEFLTEECDVMQWRFDENGRLI